ncbi:response regulator [Herbaspirillum huttiense]|jgi:DNA-binding NarL/FixJ family response regulator|uniref:response regulator n=1 Tax=Herbaspirillum huttiense TaxID=863372 RepID=UPI00055647CC|nr:response regulator transcription factor [Herbaspirillum sp. B39]
MNIVLVDDHIMMRAGLRCLIEKLEGQQVIGEVEAGPVALHVIQSVAPDAVIIDISTDTRKGLALLADICSKCPASRVVIVGNQPDAELLAEVMRMGVAAYLLKQSNPAELDIALQAVARNECYLTPAVAKSMISHCLYTGPARQTQADPLTPRQHQILAMIAHRKTTKEIAYELDLSEKTIAAHRAQIMDRIGVRDVVGLVLWAVKNNLVERQT